MGLLFALVYLVIEIVVSLRIAEAIGTLATVGWMLVAIVVGINLIRVQGPLRMMQAAQAMREGRQAGAPLVAGVYGALAGVLFLVPGFVSDILAVLLLFPFIQRIITERLKSKVAIAGIATHTHFRDVSKNAGSAGGFDAKGNVYEHESPASDDSDTEEKAVVIEYIPAKKPSSDEKADR